MIKNLLPHYWRKISLGLFGLAIGLWILNTSTPELLDLKPFVFGWILKTTFLASLLLFVFSREKLEKEKYAQLRINSLFSAVPAGGFLVIFEFFSEVLFEGEKAEITSGYNIMVFVLLMYYLTFYIRRNMKTVPAGATQK
ncbi:MAG: hypothetical protein WBL27_00930 [Salinimicrobium sp.]